MASESIQLILKYYRKAKEHAPQGTDLFIDPPDVELLRITLLLLGASVGRYRHNIVTYYDGQNVLQSTAFWITFVSDSVNADTRTELNVNTYVWFIDRVLPEIADGHTG